MLPPKIFNELLAKISGLKTSQLRQYEEKAKKTNKTLEQYLFDENVVDENKLYLKAAEYFSVPFMSLHGTEIKKEIINLVPAPLAQTHNVIA